jgi:hypothetical protein
MALYTGLFYGAFRLLRFYVRRIGKPPIIVGHMFLLNSLVNEIVTPGKVIAHKEAGQIKG